MNVERKLCNLITIPLIAKIMIQDYIVSERETHCISIRWKLRNWRTRKEQSLLFDLCKAFDYIESSHQSDFFFSFEQAFFPSCVRNESESAIHIK